MKKALIILATIAFAFVSCNEEILDNTQVENPAAQTSIVFNLTANHPDGVATKAVKTGWENGDVIYVFFNNVAAPKYLKMSFNGSSWSTTEMNGASEESLGLSEGATGTMRAVYLPFGNTLSVGAMGSSFTFSETTYSYYLTATPLDYTVTNNTVSGAFNMEVPEGYIQFFLDDASADPATKIELREPHLTPQGIASIADDGTITHTDVAHGAPLPGYVYDKAVKQTGEAKGYLFSGILAEGARDTETDYDFTVVSGGWEGTYYAKAFTGKKWYRSASEGRALKMPALSDWTPITHYKPIDLGCDVTVGEVKKRIYWAICNLGAENDYDYGDYFAWGETKGYHDDSKYFYWDSYKWGSGQKDLIKYCNDAEYGRDGFVDALTTLQPGDDAAHVSLGGKFRMPTIVEIKALIETKNNRTKYTWTWCNGSGIKYKNTSVTGWKIENNSSSAILFLPAAGCRRQLSLADVGSYGFYWSSSLDYPPHSGQVLLFTSSRVEKSFNTRYLGFPIRPISE